MAAADSLTTARLRELLDYDPLTGIFTYRIAVGRWGNIPAGSSAGCTDKTDGYVKLKIDGMQHRAHRVAWFYVHGVWPENDIDHRDTVRDHNWIENLREADDNLNNQNRRRANSRSITHLLGVCTPKRGRPRASIMINGERIYLGAFDTPEQAHAAYLKAKRELHPGCTL